MASTEILTIGDLHLDGLRTLMDGIFGSQFNADSFIYDAARQAIQYARENGIKHIVFLGDIFDHPFPSQAQQREFLTFISSLFEFEVYIIPGNHDYSHEGVISLELSEFATRISSMKHVHFFLKPTLTEIDKVPFRFLPWPHMNTKKLKLSPTISAVNIAHVEQVGALADSGRKLKDDVAFDLNDKNDYWIIGHLHRRQLVKKRISYPGTLFQKNFGEPLPKGFAHYDIKYIKKTNVIKVNPKFIPIQPPFELHNLRISTPKDLELIEPMASSPPYKLYKLFKKDDVGLPSNFREVNPHVIMATGWKNKKEAKLMEENNLLLPPAKQIEQNDVIFNGLTKLLKSKGLTKKQRRKAIHIVENIIPSLRT